MENINLKIHKQELSSLVNPLGTRDHSYFYDGLIAETDNYELVAAGEIETVNNEEYQVDSEVADAYANDKFKANNWFEIIPKDNYDEPFVCNSDKYPEALLELIDTELNRREIPRELSIDIYYSEANNGYMYNIYDTVSANEKDSRDSIDGGLCTGTIQDALNMAYESARNIIKS